MTPFICIKIYGYLKLGDLYILEKTAEIELMMKHAFYNLKKILLRVDKILTFKYNMSFSI